MGNGRIRLMYMYACMHNSYGPVPKLLVKVKAIEWLYRGDVPWTVDLGSPRRLKIEGESFNIAPHAMIRYRHQQQHHHQHSYWYWITTLVLILSFHLNLNNDIWLLYALRTPSAAPPSPTSGAGRLRGALPLLCPRPWRPEVP